MSNRMEFIWQNKERVRSVITSNLLELGAKIKVFSVNLNLMISWLLNRLRPAMTGNVLA